MTRLERRHKEGNKSLILRGGWSEAVDDLLFNLPGAAL